MAVEFVFGLEYWQLPENRYEDLMLVLDHWRAPVEVSVVLCSARESFHRSVLPRNHGCSLQRACCFQNSGDLVRGLTVSVKAVLEPQSSCFLYHL